MLMLMLMMRRCSGRSGHGVIEREFRVESAREDVFFFVEKGFFALEDPRTRNNMSTTSIAKRVFLECVELSVVDDVGDTFIENMNHLSPNAVGDLGEFITILAH